MVNCVGMINTDKYPAKSTKYFPAKPLKLRGETHAGFTRFAWQSGWFIDRRLSPVLILDIWVPFYLSL